MSHKSNRPKLTKADLAKLLQDIEDTGFGRDTVNIHQVLKGQENFYGNPGNPRREAFLRKFYQLRRNSLENYRK